jgi:acetyl-CoA C-acetyltransferase
MFDHPAACAKFLRVPYEITGQADAIHPNTPVIVGVGQHSERIDEPAYRGMSAVEIGAQAARAAVDDAKASDPAAVIASVSVIAGVRQFDASSPTYPAPLGRTNNFPRAVAARLEATPPRAILDIAGGQSPQRLVNELAASIAVGDTDVALLVGAEALSTVRHLVGSENAPDWNDEVDGDLEDRGAGRKGLTSRYLRAHGLSTPASQYAIFEYARRARLGLSRDEYARTMGELLAPFSQVASNNPHASTRVGRTAEELATVDERNRMVMEPYSRYLMARENVNQGAAVLLMSVQKARDLGIPSDRWVYLHGHADLHSPDVVRRPDLGAFPAGVQAVQHALEVAGIGLPDVGTVDLYSCFPIAVFSICDGLGLDPADPRGLTVTGGLPFFGGAGNNYSMHAIAETTQRMRSAPGTFGLVGANGGYQSKYSVGIYSTTPRNWRNDRSTRIQADIDDQELVEITRHADGWAMIETATAEYTRDGLPQSASIVARLERSGQRFLALVADGDDELLNRVIDGTACGMRIYARALAAGNRVSVDRERMDELIPERAPAFRDDYEFIDVRRDGHILEVVINRPQARNALHPPANDELAEIFDAYFDDPELWVAILTGAGDKAFSAGNDLIYTGSGKPMWIPVTGFAGLTSRAFLPKPVIAAVNGFAYGGGFEIALACHLIVADDTAKFALSEAKVGLAAGAGGLVRLPRKVPTNVANEMILTGRALRGEEAHRHGLVNRVAPAGQALEVARELAAEIAAVSPTSVRVSLKMMDEAAAITDTNAAAAAYSHAADEITTSDDAHEGMTAFAEKRAPQWLNR